jgi:hypothetical protein
MKSTITSLFEKQYLKKNKKCNLHNCSQYNKNPATALYPETLAEPLVCGWDVGV